jgi:hypothetical protein
VFRRCLITGSIWCNYRWCSRWTKWYLSTFFSAFLQFSSANLHSAILICHRPLTCAIALTRQKFVASCAFNLWASSLIQNFAGYRETNCFTWQVHWFEKRKMITFINSVLKCLNHSKESDSFKLLVGKIKGNRPLGRSRRSRRIILKWILQN